MVKTDSTGIKWKRWSKDSPLTAGCWALQCGTGRPGRHDPPLYRQDEYWPQTRSQGGKGMVNPGPRPLRGAAASPSPLFPTHVGLLDFCLYLFRMKWILTGKINSTGVLTLSDISVPKSERIPLACRIKHLIKFHRTRHTDTNKYR